MRSTITASASSPVTIYVENLDLNRFKGVEYERALQTFLQVKFRDRPIGVVVPVGTEALDYALRWRSELWPGVPLAFSFVDEAAIDGSKLPAGVTGTTARIRLLDMVASARAIVPGLKHVALVGDALETQQIFRHFKNEIPAVSADIEVIDLTGLRMAELRKRVAVLPEDSAILYSAVYSDGAGTYFPPADAVAMIAEVANRPIVAPLETYVGRGAVGGLVVLPSKVGEEAAQLALRIIEGADPSGIAVAAGDSVRPVFDWNQLQRWNIDEANLPAGSDIRNRELSIWQKYPQELAAIAIVVLFQTSLIAALLYQHRLRHRAEVEARQRMNELAHLNRHATAGELSASIAHELNQPLGTILANAETAELLLESPDPDLEVVRGIIANIKSNNYRASEVIVRLRRLLKKAQLKTQNVDINDTVREVFEFTAVQASANDVIMSSALTSMPLLVRGDPIQLQQVVLNLVMNGIEAIREGRNGSRRIVGRTGQVDDGWVEVSVTDTGPGIGPERIPHVFDAFFTTKEHGMGMGLSIARTIIEAHGGSIHAESRGGEGADFRFRLPVVRPEAV